MFLDDPSVKGLIERTKQVKEYKNLELSAKVSVS